MPRNTQKENIMRYLKVSEAEAEEIMAADKAIDRGERMDFDLSPEKEKEAKKMGNVRTHSAKTSKAKREKVADEIKIALIQAIYEEMSKKYPNSVEKVNAEREISLKIGENHYSITLTKHRTAKK